MRATRQTTGRRGFTFLEVQVAFVLLGVGLAGLCPLIVMQLRLSRVLARSNVRRHESATMNTFIKAAPSLSPATTYLCPHPFDPSNTDRTYFLVPETNPWFRKFGNPAVLQADAPSPVIAPVGPLRYQVEFTGPAVLDGDTVVVSVRVTKTPPDPTVSPP